MAMVNMSTATTQMHKGWFTSQERTRWDDWNRVLDLAVEALALVALDHLVEEVEVEHINRCRSLTHIRWRLTRNQSTKGRTTIFLTNPIWSLAASSILGNMEYWWTYETTTTTTSMKTHCWHIHLCTSTTYRHFWTLPKRITQNYMTKSTVMGMDSTSTLKIMHIMNTLRTQNLKSFIHLHHQALFLEFSSLSSCL